jgi:3-dehydroquinate synthase
LLSALGLPTEGPLPPPDAILGAMRLDKKYRQGSRFVLLEAAGRPRVVTDIPEDRVRAALAAAGAVRGDKV